MNTFVKKHAYQIVGIVIVLVGLWLIKKDRPNQPSTTSAPTNPQVETIKPTTQELTGVLKISNHSQRGNLMLETAEQTIYLFTTRDYSKLLNTPVVLKINGTLENFSLIDIFAK